MGKRRRLRGEPPGVLAVGAAKEFSVQLANADRQTLGDCPGHRPLPCRRTHGRGGIALYVLHQTVIVMLGFYVVEWLISAALKYLIICALSLAVILAIYDLGVRRTRATRFLFGMKPRTDHPAPRP